MLGNVDHAKKSWDLLQNCQLQVDFGIVDKITSMLEDIFFGPFHFVVGKMLRASLSINSILLNSEVLYGMNKEDIKNLKL